MRAVMAENRYKNKISIFATPRCKYIMHLVYKELSSVAAT
jgi:hypothetical protein